MPLTEPPSPNNWPIRCRVLPHTAPSFPGPNCGELGAAENWRCFSSRFQSFHVFLLLSSQPSAEDTQPTAANNASVSLSCSKKLNTSNLVPATTLNHILRFLLLARSDRSASHHACQYVGCNGYVLAGPATGQVRLFFLSPSSPLQSLTATEPLRLQFL